MLTRGQSAKGRTRRVGAPIAIGGGVRLFGPKTKKGAKLLRFAPSYEVGTGFEPV